MLLCPTGLRLDKFAQLTQPNGEDVTVATHIQTCEELARLLVRPNLTHLDLICCIGMFINALCVTRSEQLSPIYFAQLQHHAKQLLECDLAHCDALSKDLHAWTIFQTASTMLPNSFIKSVHTLGDLRLALAVKVTVAYANHTWDDMKRCLRRFICSEICIKVFENVWLVGHEQSKCDRVCQ